jgi:hypothetical protein
MHSKILAVVLPAFAAALPQNAVTSPPDGIIIRDTTYSGSGCPQGSVSTSTSDDKTVSPKYSNNSVSEPSTKTFSKPNFIMVTPEYWLLPKPYTNFTV